MKSKSDVLRLKTAFKLSSAFRSTRSDYKNFIAPDAVIIQTAGWGVETPPLSLASLSAFGRVHGYKILPLDLNIDQYFNRTEKYQHIWDIDQSQWFWNNHSLVQEYFKDNEELIRKQAEAIVKTETKLVCFSVYASCIELSFIYARLIRELEPKIKIVFGGPHVSLNMAGKYALEQPFVDAIAQGEGEFIFLDLLVKTKFDTGFQGMPGIIYKDHDGKIINNGKAESIRNLSQLPYADFSDFILSQYKEPDRLPLMSSRGCPNQCIYCSEVVFWETYRGYGATRMADEIEYQQKLNPSFRHVDFQDSLVNGHIGRLEEFADEIIKRGIKITWAGQAVIRREMEYDLFKKLHAAGCVCLAYGLETSTIGLMLGIGKLLAKNTDIDRLVEDAHRAGISCAYNFMFGMPGETEEDAQMSLEFLRKHKDHVGWINPSAAFCGFTPGTPGYDSPEKFGIKPSPVSQQYWETIDGTNNLLVRLRRFEDFCKLARELDVNSTYPHEKLLDRDRLIGNYHHFYCNYTEALPHFEKWLALNPNDEEIKFKYGECLNYKK